MRRGQYACSSTQSSDIAGRYDRQSSLLGEEGQRLLSKSKVGIAGCGGLGTNVATALASAGIGGMILADGDVPDITNLNRQYVFREDDGRNKAEILTEWIRTMNPSVEAEAFTAFLNADNIDVFDGCDVLVDCLDDATSRKLLNKYAVSKGKTLVHGGVNGFFGQVTVVIPGRTPCLECIMPDSDRKHVPSISPAVSMIGSLQASEVIKTVAGHGESLAGRLWFMDMNDCFSEIVNVKRRQGCPVCDRLFR